MVGVEPALTLPDQLPPPTAAARTRRPVGPGVLGVVGAAVPALLMLREVARAGRLDVGDYWTVLARVTDDSGALSVRHLFSLQNEHPTVLPGLLYYLTARWAGGDNRALGLATWLCALLALVLLVRLLPRSLPAGTRAALTVLLGFLVFAPRGLHNFAYGMSGAAWWSAAAAVVGAVTAWHRGHRGVACLLGAVGCLCYGTAFAVWPALLVLALLRRDARAWLALPVVCGVLTALGWQALGGRGSELPVSTPPAPTELASVVVSTAGSLFATTSVDVAVVAGAVVLVALLHALAVVWWPARPLLLPGASAHPRAGELAPWAAVAVWASGALLLVSAGRTSLGPAAGLAGRYTSVVGLLVAGTAVMLLATTRVAPGLLVGVLVLSTLAASTGETTTVHANQRDLALQAVAIRLGVPATVTEDFYDPRATAATRALRAYPFTDDFALGCGVRPGATLDVSAVPDLPGPAGLDTGGPAGAVDTVLPGPATVLAGQQTGSGVRISGWAGFDGVRPRCVLVTTPAGLVVGGGTVGRPRVDLTLLAGVHDQGLGFAVVAPGTTAPLLVLVVGGATPGGPGTYRLAVDTPASPLPQQAAPAPVASGVGQ